MAQFCIKGHDTFICGRSKQYTCKDCMKVNRAKWEQLHPGRNKELSIESHLRLKFGITPQQKKDLIASQNSLCLGCYKTFKNDSEACIDHSHETGQVRAILCRIDNAILGLVEEDSNRLRRLADYLDKFKVGK